MMNEFEEEYWEQLHTLIWTGFYNLDQLSEVLQDMIEDHSYQELEEPADQPMLQQKVEREFQRKIEEEKSWPETTDCDRLNTAFEEMNQIGIIAIQNAGYTISDGIEDVSQEVEERNSKQILGYCFYHQQDLEHAIEDRELHLAFGDLSDNPEQMVSVGIRVKQILEKHRFDVEWDEDPEKRISILDFDWKKRTIMSS